MFYRSTRIGKNGVPFTMYKIKTLKDGVGNFAHEREYTRYGRLLRRFKIDELPQLYNILRGEMAFFGPRPRDPQEVATYPDHIKSKLLSVKPGLLSLAGIYFIDEEALLAKSADPHNDYFNKILPIKTALDFYYIDNRSWLLNISLVWGAVKARLYARES